MYLKILIDPMSNPARLGSSDHMLTKCNTNSVINHVDHQVIVFCATITPTGA